VIGEKVFRKVGLYFLKVGIQLRRELQELGLLGERGTEQNDE